MNDSGMFEGPMSEVADLEPGDILGRVAPEILQRAVDLSRRALHTPAAMIVSATDLEAARQVVRSASGFAVPSEPITRNGHDGTSPVLEVSGFTAAAHLEVPIRLVSGRDIALLCAMDSAPRGWSEADIDLLRDIADLLAAQIDARSDLLADVNRELRAPLQAVIGFTDFLKTEREPDIVAHHIRSIQAATDDLLALLDDLPARAGQFAADAPRAVSDEEIDSPASEAGSLRILLADDLDLNRRLVADMLGTDGHMVDCVADGSEAVRAASTRPYDLILMDMIMPVMDGIAATRAIRALPGPAARTPIVALTANSFNEQLDSCLEAGMDATLTKPMSLEALTTAVRTWTRTGPESPEPATAQ